MTDQSQPGSRIQPVDGLRAVAVLGVLWTHVWKFTGYQHVNVGAGMFKVDLNRVLAIFGNGVDLFFVISGFCMYWMYARRVSGFTACSYFSFVKQRWFRIAPAYYTAAAVCALGLFLVNGVFPFGDLATHLVFLNGTLPNSGHLAAPFWSLAVEWHFYLLLPFLIALASLLSIRTALAVSVFGCLSFRLWQYALAFPFESVWADQIPMRFVEFAWGMWVGALVSKQSHLPVLFRGARGFLLAGAIAYAGRMLMVHEVFSFAGKAGLLCKIFGEPFMALGFALILWNVISDNSLFSRFLCTVPMQVTGRWSYSIYLWHWWPTFWITTWFCAKLGAGASAEILSLTISGMIIIPACGLSYRLLEAPYFAARPRPSALSPGSVGSGAAFLSEEAATKIKSGLMPGVHR